MTNAYQIVFPIFPSVFGDYPPSKLIFSSSNSNTSERNQIWKEDHRSDWVKMKMLSGSPTIQPKYLDEEEVVLLNRFSGNKVAAWGEGQNERKTHLYDSTLHFYFQSPEIWMKKFFFMDVTLFIISCYEISDKFIHYPNLFPSQSLHISRVSSGIESFLTWNFQLTVILSTSSLREKSLSQQVFWPISFSLQTENNLIQFITANFPLWMQSMGSFVNEIFLCVCLCYLFTFWEPF